LAEALALLDAKAGKSSGGRAIKAPPKTRTAKTPVKVAVTARPAKPAKPATTARSQAAKPPPAAETGRKTPRSAKK